MVLKIAIGHTSSRGRNASAATPFSIGKELSCRLSYQSTSYLTQSKPWQYHIPPATKTGTCILCRIVPGARDFQLAAQTDRQERNTDTLILRYLESRDLRLFLSLGNCMALVLIDIAFTVGFTNGVPFQDDEPQRYLLTFKATSGESLECLFEAPRRLVCKVAGRLKTKYCFN